MSTKVIKVVKCDRCGTTEEAPDVSSLPDRWYQVSNNNGKTFHFCPPCVKRALKV